ncbi:MAG: hypothetical protein AAF456_11555 [Planctomycetota bacterium]
MSRIFRPLGLFTAALLILTVGSFAAAQPVDFAGSSNAAGAVQNPGGPTAFARPAGNQAYDLGFSGSVMPGVGIQIQFVQPNGPMSQMTSATNPALGINTAEQGDIIVAVNNAPVQSMQALQAALAASGGRCTITLRNVRTGANELWNVMAMPVAGPMQPAVVYSLQIGGQEVPGQGIRIQSVTPGGAATRMADPFNPAGPPMQMDIGDIITSVNGMPTRSGAEFQAAMQTLAVSGGQGQLTLIDVRTGQMRTFNFVAVPTPANNPVPNPPVPNPPVPNPPMPNPNPNVNPNPNPNVNPNPNPNINPNPNSGPQLDPNSPRKVHVVIAGQSGTAETAFNSIVEISLRELENMLGLFATSDNNQSGQPDFLGSKTILRGDQCTAQNIKQTLMNLPTNPNDTIFFYYVGHGANDTNGHYFQLAQTGGFDLPRREVAQIMMQKGVRLSVLVSGSCNQPGQMARVEARASVRNTRINGLTGLEDLLLNYRGFIDLNSASEGQYGWGDNTSGEFFSSVFATSFGTSGGTDWQTKLTGIGTRANELYQQKRQEAVNSGGAPVQMQQQLEMTPRVYSMQVQRDPYNVNMGPRVVTQTTYYSVVVPGG